MPHSEVKNSSNLSDVVGKLDKCFGINYALEGDRVGLQIGQGEWSVRKIMTTMEITASVIKEAIQNDIDLLVVFHPLIYTPLKSVTDNNLIDSFVLELIKNQIGVYVVHTALDTHPNGNNQYLGEQLGLSKISFLDDSPSFIGVAGDIVRDLSSDQKRGMGIIGMYNGSYAKLLEDLSSCLGSVPRYSDYELDKVIKKIAIVCGSGLSLAGIAAAQGADAFITADVSYHQYRAFGQMVVIDPGHWEMEQWSGEIMNKLIRIFFSSSDLVIFNSSVRTNFAKQYIHSIKKS